MNILKLAHNLEFADLYNRDGLVKIDAIFFDFLQNSDSELATRFASARSNPDALDNKSESQLIIDLAPHVEDFIGELFDISKEIRELQAQHNELAPIYSCKRLFVQRRALKQVSEVSDQGSGFRFQGTELEFAVKVNKLLENADENAAELDDYAKYAAWAVLSDEGRAKHKNGVLFKVPKKLDISNLVPLETEIRDGYTVLKSKHIRKRHGFKLTDNGCERAYALDQANYCIFCHNQGKDSCSKGMRDKEGAFKKNELDITLAGCPLEEKISEMNMLKSQGFSVGALAIVTVDNPMCAATGHRICNDCMKSCIYQKQEPVNIPQVESQTLRDVLALPWGFEIYSLFTRWNPLNIRRPIPKALTGNNILVVGMGPAGFTLAHHLMNDGHNITAIDALKIEPLPPHLLNNPIYDARRELFEELDERIIWGFGGVAEYGITVRWDKNFLKLIRLLLQRRAQFEVYGGVRLGSQITVESAFEYYQFDHIALCMGAGKPTIPDIPNALARGARAASDFLMALQLTGAAKEKSLANLQIRLPVVVIGGGLTAIDTATESLAYYPVQVEKFLKRMEIIGKDKLYAKLNEEEREIADEFILHAKMLREAPKARHIELMKQWGGVKVLYRKELSDAPSYRLNHEEVELAMEEGIEFVPNVTPTAVEVDGRGHVLGIRCQKTPSPSMGEGRGGGDEITSGGYEIAARTILYAAGTSPNTVLARESVYEIELDGKYFKAIDENGEWVVPERVAKPSKPFVLMNRFQGSGVRSQKSESRGQKTPSPFMGEGRGGGDEITSGSKDKFISFFGDLHPSYAGNVVKAMASAKQGYSVVSGQLSVVGGQKTPTLTLPHRGGGDKKTPSPFMGEGRVGGVNYELTATVHQINRLTPTIVEVVIKAPAAAREFKAGQFYRLQNYEVTPTLTRGGGDSETPSPFMGEGRGGGQIMEPLAMTGAWVDKEQGLISVIALEMGGSSSLLQYLQEGEPIILMGPTGTPTEIYANKNIMLVGGGLGNAVLFSIGKAMRESGSKVLYFAGYKKAIDRYKVEEIEAAADVVVWCCDEESDFKANRQSDRTFTGNIIEAIKAYGEGIIAGEIALNEIDHIIAIGSDKMMEAVANARHNALKPYLQAKHTAVGSINSPMQCMMKEICAQCLQKHIDPETGEETYVFSCFNQDQELDRVSFPHLNERLKQNSLQEKLAAMLIAERLDV